MPAPSPPARNHCIYPTKTLATDNLRQKIKHKAETKKSWTIIYTTNIDNNNINIKFFHQNMGFKYNVLEPCQAKNIANWHVCSHDQTNLEIICSSWVCGKKVVELQLPSKWQCDTRNLADTKHVKMRVLRTLTTKFGGGWDSLVNQIN